MPNCRKLVFFCGISILLAACAGNPKAVDPSAAGGKQPKQYLDGQSGATVAVPDKPLLFAHDRGEHGADLRDYVTMNGATVDQAGKRNCLLMAYAWSTLDARYEPERPVPEALVLVADGRRITLDASGGSPAQFGIIHLVGAPTGRTVKPFVLSTDLGTLATIGSAQNLQLQASRGGNTVDYVLWDDQRKELARFVQLLNGEC